MHRVLQAYVDGYAAPFDQCMVAVTRTWEGRCVCICACCACAPLYVHLLQIVRVAFASNCACIPRAVSVSRVGYVSVVCAGLACLRCIFFNCAYFGSFCRIVVHFGA